MRLLTLAAAAALGGFALHALFRQQAAGTPDRPDGAAGATRRTGSSGRLAGDGSSSGESGDGANSPNGAERLRARHPAGALADAGATGLGLVGAGSREDEYARTTGLADFSRGA